MLQKIESFFSGNKVFILGSLSAIGVVIQQYVTQATIDFKVVGFAIVIAVLSYLAKALTGTVASIVGIIAGVATTVSQVAAGGKISLGTLILSTALAVIGVVTSGAQSTKVATTPNS